MHVRRSQRHSDDPPVAVALVHRVVGIGGLVRAVEGADPQMDDADGLRVPIVGWTGHRGGEPIRGGGREPHSRYAVLGS